MRRTARRTAQPADPRIVKAPAESLLLQAPRECLIAKCGCAWGKANGGASDAESGRRGAQRGKWTRVNDDDCEVGAEKGASRVCDLARDRGEGEEVARFARRVQAQGVRGR